MVRDCRESIICGSLVIGKDLQHLLHSAFLPPVLLFLELSDVASSKQPHVKHQGQQHVVHRTVPRGRHGTGVRRADRVVPQQWQEYLLNTPARRLVWRSPRNAVIAFDIHSTASSGRPSDNAELDCSNMVRALG